MLNRIPQGARVTSDWREAGRNVYPLGYHAEVTLLMLEADLTYEDGFVGKANLVDVYNNGRLVFTRKFFGETSRADAMREAMDAVNSLMHAYS